MPLESCVMWSVSCCSALVDFLYCSTAFQGNPFVVRSSCSLDLSDHMRNGDYPPTRLEAQYDAACLLGGAKLQQNPESSVGVLGESNSSTSESSGYYVANQFRAQPFPASGGKGVNILASPTADLGKLLACLHGLKASGASSLVTSIKTAQLALKHRKNRNGAQRVVIFVGSPVDEEERELARLGAVLKKSSVRILLSC